MCTNSIKVTPVSSFYFICRPRLSVDEIAKLLSEASGGENLSTLSSTKKSPIKLKGNLIFLWMINSHQLQ
jgi:hypothetical protein